MTLQQQNLKNICDKYYGMSEMPTQRTCTIVQKIFFIDKQWTGNQDKNYPDRTAQKCSYFWPTIWYGMDAYITGSW